MTPLPHRLPPLRRLPSKIFVRHSFSVVAGPDIRVRPCLRAAQKIAMPHCGIALECDFAKQDEMPQALRVVAAFGALIYFCGLDRGP